MKIARTAVAFLCLVTLGGLGSRATAQAPIGRDQFAPWIAKNHPNIMSGDTRVNAVLIVVDTNSQYVASVADSLPLETKLAIDSAFASVGAHNAVDEMARELVAGRLRVLDTEGPAVYIVDGVRVSRVDSLSANAVENIEFRRGADAVKYGAAPNGGAILVTMTHYGHREQVINANHRQRLTKLGIQPERVDLGDVQMMHVRAGVVGPEPLYITVLRLKRE